MKILVTGGAGFIGSHLVDRLIKEDYQVRIYDNLDFQVHQGKIPDYINKKAELFFGDILDKERLYTAIKDCDTIFHLASAVGVGQSQYQISHYVETNTLGTANLLDIIVNKPHKIKKIILSSSMSMYGEGMYECPKCGKVKPKLRELKHSKYQKNEEFWEPKCPKCNGDIKPIPTTEDIPIEPNSIYAYTKRHQEEMLMLIGKTYSIPVTALRFFNVYGPRQSLSNPYTGVAAIFLSRIKNKQSPVIYEDGNQTRDFIWIEDIIEGLFMALTNKKSDYQVFNLGTGNPIKIKDIAVIIQQILKENIKPLITYKFRKGDVRHCIADISKIKKYLGFQPKTSLKEGMVKLIKWSENIKAEDKFHLAEKELKEKGLTY
jgi:dTDP-L-rhamnose 4-epimerase